MLWTWCVTLIKCCPVLWMCNYCHTGMQIKEIILFLVGTHNFEYAGTCIYFYDSKVNLHCKAPNHYDSTFIVALQELFFIDLTHYKFWKYVCTGVPLSICSSMLSVWSSILFYLFSPNYPWTNNMYFSLNKNQYEYGYFKVSIYDILSIFIFCFSVDRT
jgi:hypothetical protein